MYVIPDSPFPFDLLQVEPKEQNGILAFLFYLQCTSSYVIVLQHSKKQKSTPGGKYLEKEKSLENIIL